MSVVEQTNETHPYEQLVARTRAGIAGSTGDAAWAARIEALIARYLARGAVRVEGALQRPEVGASSGNLLFNAHYDDGSGSAEHALVLRYQPTDGLLNRYDMSAQFRVQRALAQAGVKVAQPLCLDADGSILGTPGYLMRHAEGEAPRQYYYAQGPLAAADAATRTALIDDMMATLAQIHALDWQAAGPRRSAWRRPVGDVRWRRGLLLHRCPALRRPPKWPSAMRAMNAGCSTSNRW
jgi:aminoglycoside phosphotransferase (APT) family kinase protein